VTRPDGTTVELVPGAGGGSRVTFVGTDQPGIYTVTPIAETAAGSSAPSTSGAAPSARPTAAAGPSSTPGAAGSAGASPAPDDPLAPVRFAVDLFDVDESTIAPGSAAAIEALGSTAAASPDPGNGPGQGSVTERPTTRDELWVPIVLIVLVVLAVEWALYHRDGLVRIRRAVAARFRRGATGGAA
jgi:hypothetical protein